MSRWKILLPAILLIIFEIAVGVLLLVNPIEFTKWVIFALGVILLIIAIAFLVSFIRARKAGESGLGTEIGAIVCFIIGAFCVIFSLTNAFLVLMDAFYVLYGIILFVFGLNKIISFAVTRRKDAVISWFNIFSGIIALVLSVLIVFYPQTAAIAVWIIIGIGLLVEAVFDIIAVIHTAILMKNVKVSVATIEVSAEDKPQNDDAQSLIDAVVEDESEN